RLDAGCLRGLAGRHHHPAAQAGQGEDIMSHEPTPGDRRFMRIVHDALRRDLARAGAALAEAPPAARTTAIGEHVAWMMDFLEIHHHGEDAGVWPVVRERDSRAVATLDALEAHHP